MYDDVFRGNLKRFISVFYISIHINTYKLRWTIALEFITVAVLRYVVLSQDDMYQLILLAIAKAVGGRQDVSAVDQAASTVVLDISFPI